MANSNGKITAPVSFADVNHVLGTSHTDLGALCKDTHINKWARFKPIKVNLIPALTHNTIAGTTVHFGMELINGNWNTFKQKLSEYIGLMFGATQTASIGTKAEWIDGAKYTKPSGGAASPYRLSDFASAENGNLGYNHSAQLMYNWPDYSHTAPSAGTIDSVINPLIDYSSGRAEININTLPSETELPDDSGIFEALNIPLSISGKTHNDYNSISAIELIKAVGGIGSYQRGVVLVDKAGWVSDFNAVGSIPWGTWKSSQSEATLYGEWVAVEYYCNYNETSFCMIPNFDYPAFFTYGSGPSVQLAFAKDPAIGHIESQQNNKMYISFCQLTSESLSNYTIYVSLIKVVNNTESVIERALLSTYTVVTSGATWYQKYINVDYPSQSPAGTIFKLKIEWTDNRQSSHYGTYWLENIVLTV